jgi:uncharacterized protein YjbJ (UPF0337 family)
MRIDRSTTRGVVFRQVSYGSAIARDSGADSQFASKGDLMNTDILKGKWTQVKGEIRSKWGKLTDNDLMEIQGDAEKMIGKLQERYGYKRDQAEKELKEFLNTPPGQTRRSA